MRKHIRQGASGLTVGGGKNDFHVGMTACQPDQIRAGVAAGAQYAHSDFLAVHATCSLQPADDTIHMPDDKMKRPGGAHRAFHETYRISLALGELEAAASLAAAVLFALHRAAVAGQEAVLLQGRPQGGFIKAQRLRYAVP